jgi:NADH dehydrogenase
MMAVIGGRDGIAKISGHNFTGTPAWFMWKTYYLTMLPTFEKKLKVAIDWTVNLFFKRDITLVRKIKRKSLNKFDLDDISSLDQVLFKAEASPPNQKTS